MKKLLEPLVAVLGLAALAWLLSSPSRPADAQVAMWTSCKAVCLTSCRLEGKSDTHCEASAECKKLDGYFAPQDPRIERDAAAAAVRLGQCKRCAATGRPGRCATDIFGGATYGGRSYGGSTYGGRDRIGDFARCFEDSVRDRIREGYYVKNYGFIRNVRTAVGAVNPFLDRSRGGRCGEYGEWGMTWIKPCVDKVFPGAIVDDLFVEEKSSAHKKHVGDYVDAIYEANHRATRVVLPDGRRFVVDYWDGVGSGAPHLQTQTEWIQKWRDRIGFADSVVDLSDDEVVLKKAVLRLGEAKGFDLFRKSNKGAKTDAPEIWIRSWQRESW